MKPLIEKVLELLNADTVTKNTIGIKTISLFRNDPPAGYVAGDEYPFITIDIPGAGENMKESGQDELLEAVDIMFRTWAISSEDGSEDGAQTVLDCSDQIQKIFICGGFDLSSGYVTNVNKFSESFEIDPEKDINGSDVFTNLLTLTFWVNRIL